MTPKQQRIAIARFCGWNVVSAVGKLPIWVSRKDHQTIVLPDYLNDLNAMHEAENKLTDSQHGDFTVHLHAIVASKEELHEWNKNRVYCDERRRYVSSTASQRAEALLRAIGKWKD